jgi:hypothetical protein
MTCVSCHAAGASSKQSTAGKLQRDLAVFPKDKPDISHSEFWEQTVAPLLAQHFSIRLEPLLNLPYCQRRARISSKGLVFYGERQSKKLLRKISMATGEIDLRWAFDEHEIRLPFDVQEFERLLALRGSKSSD